MLMRNDLLDVMADAVSSALGCEVLTSLADAHERPESVSLAVGVPEAPTAYFDFEQSVKVRVTCYVRRFSEEAAKADAADAERAVRLSALESANGSYEIRKHETTRPGPLPWDQSGRYVWFFETTIEYKEA